MSGTEYERELKGILEADRDILFLNTKTTSTEETRNYYLIEKIPFMVVRAAGSLGIDLVALRGEFSFPIEVKSSKHRVLRLSTHYLGEQAEAYLDLTSRANIIPLYAYRLKGAKGDKWRIFALPFIRESRRTVLFSSVPRARVTSSGNFVLEWEKGLPLNKFISYLYTLIDPEDVH